MTELGADTDQLDGLSRDVDRLGRRLAGSAGEITAKVSASWWQGPEADRFRTWWRGTGAGQLNGAADWLANLGRGLRRQANTQRQTSGGSQVGAVPVGPPAGPVDTPSSDRDDWLFDDCWFPDDETSDGRPRLESHFPRTPAEPPSHAVTLPAEPPADVDLPGEFVTLPGEPPLEAVPLPAEHLPADIDVPRVPLPAEHLPADVDLPRVPLEAITLPAEPPIGVELPQPPR